MTVPRFEEVRKSALALCAARAYGGTPDLDPFFEPMMDATTPALDRRPLFRRTAGGRAARWARGAGALLLLALLLWLLRHVAWARLAALLASARPGWLGAALLLQPLVLALWAALWRCFLPAGQPARYRRLLESVTLTGAAQLVTPALAAQASAGMLLVRRCGLRIGAAASVLVGEQVCEATAKAAVLLLALALAPLPAAVRGPTRIAAVLFGGAAILALLAGRFWRRAPAVLPRGRGLAAGLAIALCIKVTEAGMLVVVQRSLGVHLAPGAILLLLALAAVGIAAASVLPVPGPVGVAEATMALGYTRLGLPLELSVALVALHSAAVLLPRLAGAAGVLLADALRAARVPQATSSPDAAA